MHDIGFLRDSTIIYDIKVQVNVNNIFTGCIFVKNVEKNILPGYNINDIKKYRGIYGKHI